MKTQKGFTLVEVLIVVIIIAILASLLLPRMIAQPERAYIAEAQQLLGTMRRAQQTYMDLTSTNTYIGVTSTTDTNWAKLSMSRPTSTAFTYSCGAGGTSCVATRSSGTMANATITLNDSGSFSCGGTGGSNASYTLASNTDATKGCTT